MKQFNLSKYLQDPSKKLVTRDGREVRIICTDRNDEYPIVGLIKGIGHDGNVSEDIVTYTENGQVYSVGYQNDFDLFFAPVKKEGWVNMYRDDKGQRIINDEVYNSKEEAEANAIFTDYEYQSTAKIEWEE